MITVDASSFERKYAVAPFPISSINPAPWEITFMRLAYVNPTRFDVWIRGYMSSWFRADQCQIGSLEEMRDYLANQPMRKEPHAKPEPKAVDTVGEACAEVEGLR